LCHPSWEEGGTGRRGSPPGFRRKVLDLVEAGRPIAEVAQALGISDQSTYAWRGKTAPTAAWSQA
jgi:transposase-like protein